MPNLWYKQLHPSALSQELLWLMDGLVIHPVLGARNCAKCWGNKQQEQDRQGPQSPCCLPWPPSARGWVPCLSSGLPWLSENPLAVPHHTAAMIVYLSVSPASPEAICWLNLGSIKVLSLGVVTRNRKWHGTDEVGHRRCGQGVQGNVDRGQGRKQRKQQRPLLLLLPQGVTESVVRETCLEPDTKGLAVWLRLFCYQNRYTQRGRMWVGGCQGLGRERMGSDRSTGTGFSFEVMKMF